MAFKDIVAHLTVPIGIIFRGHGKREHIVTQLCLSDNHLIAVARATEQYPADGELRWILLNCRVDYNRIPRA